MQFNIIALHMDWVTHNTYGEEEVFSGLGEISL